MSIKIFIASADKDKKLLDQLKAHLKPLEQEGLITLWDDSNIPPGANQQRIIDEYLSAAQIVLVLISANFLTSPFYEQIEQVVQRQKEVYVVPVILRPVDWEGTVLGKLKALPEDGNPVMSKKWSDVNAAWLNVTQGIRRIAEELMIDPPSSQKEKSVISKELARKSRTTKATRQTPSRLLEDKGGSELPPAICLKPMPRSTHFAKMSSVLFQKASKSPTRLIRPEPENRTMNAIISEWSEAVRTDNPLILIFDFAADIEFALFSISRLVNGCQWVDGSGFIDASLETWKGKEGFTSKNGDSQASVLLVDFSSITPSHIFKHMSGSTEKTGPVTFESGFYKFLSWAKSAHHHVVLGMPKYLLTDVDFAAFQKLTDYIFLPDKLFSAKYVDRVKQYKQHLRGSMLFPEILTPLVSANSSSLPIVLARLLNEITTGQVVAGEDEHEAIAILLDLAHNLTAAGFYEIAFRIEQYCVTLKAKRKSIDLQADISEDTNDRLVGSLNKVAKLPVILHYGAITGGAGLGKTTALHQIEHQWTIPHLEAVGKSVETYIPLYISILSDAEFDLLKQIEATLCSDAFTWIEVETRRYQLTCHKLVFQLKSFWSLQKLFSSPILLLLDDVDTLSPLEQDKMEKDIVKLKDFSQQLGILMTFREEVTPQFQHLRRAKLRLLSEEQVKKLIPSDRSNMSIDSLPRQNTEPISSYLRNPFLLVEVICALDLTIDEISNASLNGFLKRYVNQTRSKLGPANAKRIIDEWLPGVARDHMHERRYIIPPEDNHYSELIHLASRVGLLANYAGNRNIVEFKFDYLRDYFLAQQIATEILSSNLETALLAFIDNIRQLGYSVLNWENVFKILINRIDEKDINAYVEFLSCKVNEPRLAHTCLLELGSDVQHFTSITTSQLLESIENFDRSLDERIEDARILGHLDRRIPRVEEIPSTMVEVPSSERIPRYRIAKYPVTNMEFARFVVDGGGYKNQEYWTERSWQWRKDNGLKFPLYWSNEKLNRPNYPVVGVSFFEAKAYCMWLSKHLKANFDLPSVIQWDRAAHGSEKHFELLLELYRETFRKRTVPNINIIQERIARIRPEKSLKNGHYGPKNVTSNNKELDISVENKLIDELVSLVNSALKPYREHMGHTMPKPIGMLPANATGCHDLYGNVWEWTNSVFSHVEDYVENVLRTASVYPGEAAFVKGGATGDVSNAVWAMLGGWFDPSIRFYKLGFRTVFIENSERS